MPAVWLTILISVIVPLFISVLSYLAQRRVLNEKAEETEVVELRRCVEMCEARCKELKEKELLLLQKLFEAQSELAALQMERRLKET